MSHQIDDIFKKGLSGLSENDGLEQNWQDARELLDLDNRKKKSVFWFWAVGGIVLVSLLYIFYFSLQNDEPPQLNHQSSEYAESSISKIQIPNVESEQTASTPSYTETNSKGQVDAQPEIPAVNAQTIVSSKRRQGSEIISKTASGHDGRLVSERLFVDQNIKPEVLDKEKSKYEFPLLVPKEIESSSASSQNLLKGESITHHYIDKLKILPFIVNARLNAIPAQVRHIDVKAEKRNIDFGVFGSYVINEASPTLGLFSKIDLRQKVVLDFGIGISRFSNPTREPLLAFGLDNQRGVTGSLTSMNEYYYYSLNVPIRVHYVLDDISLFGGVNIERPFLLKGRQEVSLLPENSDVDLPAPIDTQGGLGSEPILTIQDYNLNSVKELDKLFVQSMLGFSYRPSDIWQLSSSVHYSLHRKNTLSPLVDDVKISVGRHSKWLLKLRIDYLF